MEPGKRGPRQPEEVILRRRRRLADKRTIFSFLRKIIVTAAAIYLVMTYVFGVTVMRGQTMYPAIKDGDLVVYYRLDRHFHPEDVVTTVVEGKRCICRIVAQGGDVVDMTQEGDFLINGSVQSEEIFYPTFSEGSLIELPYTVPQNAYFLLSDFRIQGRDSRLFGAVMADDLDGKVFTVVRRRGI